MMRGTVIVFAKAPRAGAVKTRLAAEVGAGRAAALFRIMTECTVATALAGPWRTIIAVDSASALAGWGNVFLQSASRCVQGPGDLGDRMGRQFRAAPPGPAIIIGADAPGLRTAHLYQAFQALRGNDAVFGPAADGGYWLIGLARRRAAPDLFAGVRWSTEYALEETKKTLPLAFKTATLETLSDVDEASDLVHLGPRSIQNRQGLGRRA